MNNLHNTLHKMAITISNLSENNVYQESQFKEFHKKLQEDTLEYPAIIISEKNNNYFLNQEQQNIDLENEVKTSVAINIEIVSKNIDDIIHLEDLFINQLSHNYKLSNISNIHEVAHCYLLLSKNEKPKRQTTLNNVFSTEIAVICHDFILSKYIENPIRFELERYTQIKVLKHLYLLESLYHKLVEKYNSNDDFESEKAIDNQIKQLEKQISEMFIFKELCNDNFSHINNSFRHCYQLVTDKKINADIKSIIDSNELRVEKENEKKKEVEKRVEKMKIHFSKKGDTQLNRYTDAVVQDFKNNLSFNNIPIHGGTSFNKWYRQYEEKSISYPNILITDSFKYEFGIQSYENETKDNNKVVHEYDTSSLPVKYGIIVSIFSESFEKNKEIENSIVDYYSEQKQIKILDYRKQDEFTVINLQVSPFTEIERKQFGIIYRTTISFRLFKNVFYTCGYKLEECENNQRLQFRLLQQAEYMFIKLSYYLEAKNQLSMYYKPLIERKRSLFGFLDSADYKKVKNLYNSGMPISQEIFDSAMKSIVKYYPDLYQQFISGWSYTQIEKNIDSYINYYKNRFNFLMNLLKIPVHPMANSWYHNQIIFHSQEALVFFIKKMVNPYCELSTAVDEYTTKKYEALKNQQERERIAREERRAMRTEEENYSGGSILKTATGVALGNKMSSQESNGKRDLMGTTVCQYGVKRTCAFCPVGNKCTRH